MNHNEPHVVNGVMKLCPLPPGRTFDGFEETITVRNVPPRFEAWKPGQWWHGELDTYEREVELRSM